MEPRRSDGDGDERDQFVQPARQVSEPLGDAESDVPTERREPAHASGPSRHDRMGFERLTEYLAAFFSRRGFAKLSAGLLFASGLGGSSEAKKKHKKKKKRKHKSSPDPQCAPACTDGFDCQSGVCQCQSNVVCDGQCCGSGESCLESGCCAEDQICNDVCCSAGNVCVRGACCPQTKECDGVCCTSGQVCANIVPGGIMGCCDNPLTIRGESCCPTGSLATRLNCGSFQCKASLSGSGPGGCDLWCRVGAGGEGSYCARDIEGIPNPNDPDVECCCTAGNPVACVYPVTYPI